MTFNKEKFPVGILLFIGPPRAQIILVHINIGREWSQDRTSCDGAQSRWSKATFLTEYNNDHITNSNDTILCQSLTETEVHTHAW